MFRNGHIILSGYFLCLFLLFFANIISVLDGALATWMHVGLAGSSINSAPNLITSPQKQRAILLSGPVPATPNRSYADADWCHKVPGLVDHQVALCKRNPSVFAQVTDAAKLAIVECQNQFRHDRWNCSTTNDSSVFGKIATKGNRETAFIAAISSAAVVHAVVRACSSGNLENCSCDTRREGQLDDVGKWRWSGCSDHVEYGLDFSKLFNDAPEDIKRRDARSIRDAMHLHNKAAGRTAIQRNMQVQCRCHGVSGSCEVKTCWKVMPKFHVIGANLKEQYDRAVRIVKKSIIKLKRRNRTGRKKPIKKEELVYLEKSPDYCKTNRKRGIMGTSGRTCNASSTGPDNCGKLCCGRGHTVKTVFRTDRCECKFIWCCEVRCKTCKIRTEIHTCK